MTTISQSTTAHDPAAGLSDQLPKGPIKGSGGSIKGNPAYPDPTTGRPGARGPPLPASSRTAAQPAVKIAAATCNIQRGNYGNGTD